MGSHTCFLPDQPPVPLDGHLGTNSCPWSFEYPSLLSTKLRALGLPTLTPLWGTILLSPPPPKSFSPLLGPAHSREMTTTLTALCQHIEKGKTLACSRT